jgi:hypothetical protein
LRDGAAIKLRKAGHATFDQRSIEDLFETAQNGRR